MEGNLPLIHVVAAEVTTSANMTKTLHESFIGLNVTTLGGESVKPFAEQSLECLDVSHGHSGHEIVSTAIR
jgi:hypothetical protein